MRIKKKRICVVAVSDLSCFDRKIAAGCSSILDGNPPWSLLQHGLPVSHGRMLVKEVQPQMLARLFVECHRAVRIESAEHRCTGLEVDDSFHALEAVDRDKYWSAIVIGHIALEAASATQWGDGSVHSTQAWLYLAVTKLKDLLLSDVDLHG